MGVLKANSVRAGQGLAAAAWAPVCMFWLIVDAMRCDPHACALDSLIWPVVGDGQEDHDDVVEHARVSERRPRHAQPMPKPGALVLVSPRPWRPTWALRFRLQDGFPGRL